MTNTLEVMSWIAGIAAVPTAVVVAFVGRSRSAEQKKSKSIAGEGATAISGDVRVGEAGIVAGHNSPVSVSLAVGNDTQTANRYKRRYAIFQAVGTALKEALTEKMISPETFQCFSKAVTDSCFLLGDSPLVTYLHELRDRAGKFQAIMISMEAIPPGDEKARASIAAGKQRLWLIDQINGLSTKFEPVLRF